MPSYEKCKQHYFFGGRFSAVRCIPMGCGCVVVGRKFFYPYGGREAYAICAPTPTPPFCSGGGARNPKGVSYQRAGLRVSALPCQCVKKNTNPNGVAH